MKMRLREKYAILLGGTTLLTVLVVSILFLLFEQMTANRLYDSTAATMTRELAKQYEDRGRNITSMLSSTIALPLHWENYQQIDDLLSAARALKGVTDVRLYDQNGRLLNGGEPQTPQVAQPASEDIRNSVLKDRKWLVAHTGKETLISAPVIAGNKVIGALSLHLDEKAIAADIAAHRQVFAAAYDASERQFIGAISLALPLFLIVSMLLGIRVAGRYSRPIERLQKAAQDIAAGHQHIDWPPDRDDELGDLATSLNQMVAALRTKTVSANYLDDIISSMFDCLVVTDARERIEKINAATCRLIGYERHELINRPFAMLVTPPANMANIEDADEIAHPRRDPNESVIYSKSGHPIPVQMSRSVMRSHVDGGARRVTMFRDISLQKQREAEIEAAREDAEVANAAKSRFLANMSHELRTPLNAIIGFSSITKDALKGPLSDDYKGYSRDILESAEHLLAIINDLLDISKLEAGKMEIVESEVDLEDVLETCIRIVRHRAGERRIAIERIDDTKLPIVQADQRMLKQMVINLLSNAVKFNVEGGRIDLDGALTADGGLSLSVRDSGIGMRPEDIPKVLEPFAQVDSNLNRNYEGTGLGLAITKSMIELHGGRLEVQSAVGDGTTVILILPAARVIDLDRKWGHPA